MVRREKITITVPEYAFEKISKKSDTLLCPGCLLVHLKEECPVFDKSLRNKEATFCPPESSFMVLSRGRLNAPPQRFLLLAYRYHIFFHQMLVPKFTYCYSPISMRNKLLCDCNMKILPDNNTASSGFRSPVIREKSVDLPATVLPYQSEFSSFTYDKIRLMKNRLCFY